LNGVTYILRSVSEFVTSVNFFRQGRGIGRPGELMYGRGGLTEGRPNPQSRSQHNCGLYVIKFC